MVGITIWMGMALAFLWGCGEGNEATISTKSPVSPQGIIVAMGNSLTEGYGVDETEAYPALLAQKLHRNNHDYTVINAGISGETSTGALERLDWVLTLNPDIVILETGANDGLRGISPAIVHRNIQKIVRRLKQHNVAVILAGMQTVENMGSVYTREFTALYPAIAKEEELILIPFFLEGVAGKLSLNQPDRIHPNANGYRVIVEHIYPYVVEAIEQSR